MSFYVATACGFLRSPNLKITSITVVADIRKATTFDHHSTAIAFAKAYTQHNLPANLQHWEVLETTPYKAEQTLDKAQAV